VARKHMRKAAAVSASRVSLRHAAVRLPTRSATPDAVLAVDRRLGRLLEGWRPLGRASEPAHLLSQLHQRPMRMLLALTPSMPYDEGLIAHDVF
jgi:hypothetical protein